MASSLSKLVDNLSEDLSEDLWHHHYQNLLIIYHNNKCSDCGSNLDYIKTTGKRKNEKLILECYNCKQCYKKNLVKN